MWSELTERLNREPFEPFRIVPTSGGAYDVLSPLQLALGESQLHYYYPRSDRWVTLRMNQLAALEALEETTT